VAFNTAAAHAYTSKYEYLLRLDDDVEFKSKNWLRKLVDASVALGDKMILSPVVKGLRHPPECSNICDVAGMQLQFLEHAIGGICRLHPVKLILNDKAPYFSDVRMPLGSGDAAGIGSWCKTTLTPMAYVRHITVRHAKSTDAQEADDPAHFLQHAVFQHIPYIPAWTGRE
jgi:hypothetical protein